MSDRLAGKVCIVIGAGSGIGRASAQLFAEEGGVFVAADIDAAAEGVTRRVDVADGEETQALAAAVVAEHGRIDVLFNNAGIPGVGDVGETASKGAVLALTKSMQVDLAPDGVRVNA